jgi:hypothetical protein
MEKVLEKTNIDNIRVGDTVLHYGVERTVTRRNLKRNGFMGTTLFGDSYRLGYELVTKITFKPAKA